MQTIKTLWIRIVLSLICIFALWMVWTNIMIDYRGHPDIEGIEHILADQSYYMTGANIYLVSSWWMDRISMWWGRATWDWAWSAKAVYLWPLIILRYHSHPLNTQWINHELIHQKQCIRTACLLPLRSWWEYRWYRLQWYTHMDAYLMKTTEQEAYLNQHNLNYLSTHQIWDSFKYFSHKIDIKFDDQYRVINRSLAK